MFNERFTSQEKLYLTYPKVPLCIGFTDSQMVIGNCLYSAITNSYQLIRILKMLHVGVPRCEKCITSVKCDGLVIVVFIHTR